MWSSEYRDQDINCIGEYNKETMLDDTVGKGPGRGKKGGKREGVEGGSRGRGRVSGEREERREDGGCRWRGSILGAGRENGRRRL